MCIYGMCVRVVYIVVRILITQLSLITVARGVRDAGRRRAGVENAALSPRPWPHPKRGSCRSAFSTPPRQREQCAHLPHAAIRLGGHSG